MICHVDVLATGCKSATSRCGESLGKTGNFEIVVLGAIPEVRLPREWWRTYATEKDRMSDVIHSLSWLRKDDEAEYRRPDVILKRAGEYVKRDWLYLPLDMRKYMKKNNKNYYIGDRV